jgi:uncharacterized LabA/DUF88 family protein
MHPPGPSYLFVDGAYFVEHLQELGRDWFGAPPDFDYRGLGVNFTKVLYYDCEPAQKPSEQPADYERRRREKVAFFDQLRQLPGWHVYQGISRHRRGRAEQKEVDVLIAVDMLTHTHRKNMTRLTFITGDQDFRPLVEAVVREGMYVTLWHGMQRTVSQDLMDAADETMTLDPHVIHGLSTQEFRIANPIPGRDTIVTTEPFNGYRTISNGVQGGVCIATLWQSNSSSAYVLRQEDPSGLPRQRLMYSFHDHPNVLKRMHDYYHGETQWHDK